MAIALVLTKKATIENLSKHGFYDDAMDKICQPITRYPRGEFQAIRYHDHNVAVKIYKIHDGNKVESNALVYRYEGDQSKHRVIEYINPLGYIKDLIDAGIMELEL